MIHHNDETRDTTIQVPHVRAGRGADVGASNFHNVLFAGGDGDVPGLVLIGVSLLALEALSLVLQLSYEKCRTSNEPVKEGTRWVDPVIGGTLRCQ